MMHLSIDAGGTFIKYAWFAKGVIVKQGKEVTPRTTKEAFYEVIQQIWDQCTQPKEGISFSLPGTIHPTSGHIIQGGSLHYHHGFAFKSWYEEKFKTPITVENDARCAALAEMTSGNMVGIENGIVLTFGTGVGGCFIIRNEIYRGTHLFSGEVSVLLCDHLETHGRDAFLGNQLGIGHLVERVCAAKKVELTNGEQVFAWISEGDQVATKIFDEYCRIFAEQIFNMQMMLDPERLCVGGGVSENPIFMQGISKALQHFYDRLPVALPRLEVIACAYHNDANLWGAYYHYQQLIH